MRDEYTISLGIAVVVCILLLVFLFPDITQAIAKESEDNDLTVEMSTSGFNPQTLTISVGDTVTFLAVDNSARWPASDNHPTHSIYPGSHLDKCTTEERSMIFDSCGEVAQGGSYQFAFTEPGVWGYHDHNRPQETGEIIVE